MDKVKYFYVRTTDDMIIDMCLSQFPKVFAVYKGVTEARRLRRYTGEITMEISIK